jgi:Flp pilus assembly protein TadG
MGCAMIARLRAVLADDRGSGEVVATIVIAPVVVAFVVLVFFIGRQVDSRGAVRSAAEAGAQAAARQRDAASADAAARVVVSDMLASATSICVGGPQVAVDLSHFQPGGVVTVSVSCTVDRSDLGGLAPPDRSFVGTASAVVDTYRSAELP